MTNLPIVARAPRLKGIVKWDFFFRKKLGNCTLMNEQKKILGLGPF